MTLDHEAQPGRKPRVLIVDDQPANVHVLAAALGEDYELSFATGGERALELTSRGGVDLVLLDVMMPGLDGFEVCWRMKGDERSRETLVVFVTALGEVEDETRGFDAGGVDYITKPISAPIVRARVRTHLELKRARDLLESLAALDGLTGLVNRRRLDERLEEEWRRARRDDQWLSLMVVAVDQLEAFNDRYGYARGDEVLKTVSLALSTVVRRPADLLARYGAEEFALLLPGTTPGGAVELLARMLQEVEILAISHAASAIADHVTVSAGAVSLKPAGHASAAEALERAGARLGEAKEAGCNRAVLENLETGDTQRVETRRDR